MDQSTPVKLYALSTCVHCRAVRDFLESNHIAFSSVNVDELEKPKRREMIREVKKYNGKGSFPTLVVGEKVVVGYREEELRAVFGL